MNFWDYLYFSFVIFACLIWLAATVLYIDKKMRERRWRKRDDARAGFVDLTLVDLTPSGRAESSG